MPGSNPRGRSGPFGPAHRVGLVFNSPRHNIQVLIDGITKDSAGAVLPSCDVHLFRTLDDLEMDQTTSDANGYYQFVTGIPDERYYVVAYKAGAPDVAGVTVNTVNSLIGA